MSFIPKPFPDDSLDTDHFRVVVELTDTRYVDDVDVDCYFLNIRKDTYVYLKSESDAATIFNSYTEAYKAAFKAIDRYKEHPYYSAKTLIENEQYDTESNSWMWILFFDHIVEELLTI